MKKVNRYLFLILPIFCTAQYNFTKAEVDHAFNMCQEYKHNAEEWQRISTENLELFRQTKDTVILYQSRIKEAAIKNDLLTDRYGAMMEEYGKVKERASKRFGIGPYLGYGLMLIDNTVKAGIQVGVSVQYNLINF